MHIQFAPAAFSRLSDGEASIGEAAAYAAWPADWATRAGEAQGERLTPIFASIIEPFLVLFPAPFLASFNQDNEKFAFPGVATAAIPSREMSARTGAALFNGAISLIAWSGGQATREVEAKILAGDVARVGRAVDSALHAGLRCVFWRAGSARRGTRRHRKPDGAVFASALSGRPPDHAFTAREVANPNRFFSSVPAVSL
jgi:hypothetical protein